MEAFGNIDPEGLLPHQVSLGCRKSTPIFDRSVWINPDKPAYWGSHTTPSYRGDFLRCIISVVDGLSDAVQALVGARS